MKHPLWLAALLFWSLRWAGAGELDPAEAVAAVTDLPEPVAIRYWDVHLRTELDQNRLCA